MPPIPQKALIFGDDTRSFLSVVRSLNKMGMQVDTVSYDKTAPALSSDAIHRTFCINHQSMSLADWTQQVSNIVRDGMYSIVIPCDERSLLPLIDIQKELSNDTLYAIPRENQLDVLFDKISARQLAEQLEISVAKGNIIEHQYLSFDELAKQYGSPFVLKPNASFAKQQLNKRAEVAIISNQQQYTDYIEHAADNLLIESYFTGVGQGISVLANKGEIVTAFAHTREAEPPTGGGSTYRKSIPLNPDMLNACKSYCQAVEYSGVAMFEFKVNTNTGEWIFIEINARFWGSLPLAIFSGIDFPMLYAKQLLRIPTFVPNEYNHKAYARNFSGDLYAIKAEFDRKRGETGSVSAIQFLIVRFSGYLRIALGREKIDSFSWRDQKPFWKEVEQLVVPKIKKLPLIKHFMSTPTQHAHSMLNGEITEISFVCYGNIMRSPFAEHYFRKKLPEAIAKDLTISSYGFHQQENRQSPDSAIKAALDNQIDLTNHRSKWLQQKHIQQKQQIIFYFDENNEDRINKYYDNISAFPLGSLLPASHQQIKYIEDPYNKGDSETRECYHLITLAIDQLVHKLSEKLIR